MDILEEIKLILKELAQSQKETDRKFQETDRELKELAIEQKEQADLSASCQPTLAEYRILMVSQQSSIFLLPSKIHHHSTALVSTMPRRIVGDVIKP